MVTYRYVLADVFTDRPLTGNQLAVFTAGERIEDRLLLPIAREMNLSETVFVYPATDVATVRVRYFTTVHELDFAGHPTLGTAAIIAQEHFPKTGDIEVLLETPKGIVPVQVHRTDTSYVGWMTQPTPSVRPWDRVAALLKILKVGPSILPVEVYDNGIAHLYVTLEHRSEVLAIEPDFPALGRLCGPVRINVFAGAGRDFTSRMFSPFDLALKEDPACGSAAGPLALHLVRHGRIALDEEIAIAQGERVGRPSTLRARVSRPREGETEVRVGGTTVIVGEGRLCL